MKPRVVENLTDINMTVTYSSVYREYMVGHRYDSEILYFTDDLEDAVATAYLIAQREGVVA